ncbi:MAG: transposase [Verrucomicrobiae bacterium]|nr:transposase [Verrucomicrobiae bacterium]
MPKLASAPFLKLWEQEVFELFLAEGKITEEVVANMRSWKHSGFSVDQSVRLEAGDTAGIQRLLQYLLRCPFSQARMIRLRQGYGGTSRGHRGRESHRQERPQRGTPLSRAGGRGAPGRTFAQLPGVRSLGFKPTR